jgi:hypothetical protein
MKCYLFPILFASTVLASCGGGGGNGMTSALDSATVSGIAIDGYLSNALVFLDRNDNKSLDVDEPFARTLPDGSYALKIKTSDLGKYRVVVRAIAGETIDQDMPNQTVAADFVLVGLKETPQVISPLTTLIAIEESNQTGLTAQQAEARVKLSLGLGNSSQALTVDYGNIKNLVGNQELVKLRNHAPLIVSLIQKNLLSGGSISEKLSDALDEYKNALINNAIPSNIINSTQSLTEQQKKNIRQILAPNVQILLDAQLNTTSSKNNSGTNSNGNGTNANSGNTNNTGTGSTGSNNSAATAAATYTLSSISDAMHSTSVTLTLQASDNSIPTDVIWTVNSSDLTVQKNPIGSNKLIISLIAPQPYRDYTVEVSARHNGQTYSRSIRFWPSFTYNQPSTRLPLTHEHYSPYYMFGERVAMIPGEPSLEYFAFDNNGWVNRRITAHFDGWSTNGTPNFETGQYLFDRYDNTRRKLYSASPHKVSDKLLFIAIDGDSISGGYKILDFGQPTGTYGKWSAIGLADYWLLARSVLTSQVGSRADYKKINVQIFKLDYEGNVLGGKIVETSNIPSLGYAQVSTGVYGTNLPTIKLERHYSDVLISGFTSQFQKAAGVSLISINSLWLPLDPTTMTLKSPFWIQSTKFTRPSRTEQPDFYLTTNEWGWVIEESLPKPWQPSGSFILPLNYKDYSASNINEGWLKGNLSADYTNFSLTSFGSKSLDTSDFYDFSYAWTGNFILKASKSTRSPNTLRRFVGNTKKLFALPQLDCDYANDGQFSFNVNCNNFDSFYGLDTSTGPQVRTVPIGYKVDYATYQTDYENYSGTSGSTLSSLGLSDQNTGSSVNFELDESFRHPGCTIDKPYVAPTIPVTSVSETATVERSNAPALLNTTVSSVSGNLIISIKPYQNRAPVLCSQYKISLDQTITVRRATDASRTSVQPVLHRIYTRQQLQAPANGTYNALSNTYQPNPGFSGTDTFKIRINDKTGDQDVTIVVRVM